MSLRIADGFTLPEDAVTQTIAILARRGAGKTYTASVIVEEVIKSGLPVVILDPTGAWWGLRSSADGSKPGLPVTILGGEHGDVPLARSAGKDIAEVVISHPRPYVIDLSGFESRTAEQTFCADFLERLYRGKATKRNPLLLVVDEADMLAPQNPRGETARTLGAMEAIVRRGRIRGLGVLLITQRAAVLNKNVLNQTEVLVAMQTTGPQDRAAINEWVKGNGTDEERAAVIDSLASLEKGEAWVWSPSWLRSLSRIRVRTRETFDSGATPEAGSAAIEPRAFAEINVEELGARIAATVEQAKANDPAALKRRVAELERLLADRAEPEVRVERVEVPVLNGQVHELESILGGFVPASGQLADAASLITAAVADVQRVASSILTAVGSVHAASVAVARPVAPRPPQTAQAPRQRAERAPSAPTGDGSLKKVERLILAALAQYPAGRTVTQVAILTGYASGGGGFRNGLGALRSAGFVVGKESLLITDAGLAAIGDDWTPLPTGRALLEHWLPKLNKAERLILTALADAYPAAVITDDLGPMTGYEPTGGGFRNALGKLRTLELIERGTPRMSDDLA